MSNQITKVDLIPNGEISVCNVSQFDNGRVLPFEILENKEAYNIPNDIRVELHCRKPDGNIVTLPSENISDNIVTFISTTQLTACYGRNACEIALYGPDDYLIGSGNFVLEVERDPLLGGLNSTSAIHNLTEQIEEITTEIIGEDYYNKTEVDNKLDLKVNAADVYTKNQVDSALALKANAADVYTKNQVDSALALKANAADVYTKSQVDSALALKANAADVYTKTQVDNIILDIMPVDTASGATAEFNTPFAVPLKSVIADVTATGGEGTPEAPVPVVGYPEAVITANGDDIIVVFGQRVYGGKLIILPDRTYIHVTYGKDSFSNKNFDQYSTGFFAITSFTSKPNCTGLCEIYTVVIDKNYASSPDNSMQFRGNQILIKDTSCADTTALIARTGSHEFIYELVTPFDIDLTPEVILAISGDNEVSSDTGNIEVKYKTTIQDYLDNHTGG